MSIEIVTRLCLNSKLHILYGVVLFTSSWSLQNAELHCFDPVENEWEVKAETCNPHYGSSLFFVNNRTYVAGGYNSTGPDGSLQGNPAHVEVHDEEKTLCCEAKTRSSKQP